MATPSPEQPAERGLLARLGLIAGPLLAVLFIAGPTSGFVLDPGRPELNRMAGVAVWMAVWWLSEAVAPAVTGLLPLALLPTLSVLSAKETAACYGDSLIFLYLGGFLIALAAEGTGLQRRIALATVALIGDSPARVVLGIMLATGLMSMWMSNTATALVMLPIAASVAAQARSQSPDSREAIHFGVAVMLGIAYAASIGGCGTLIGTPPNLAFKQIFVQQFPTAPPISFAGWMLVATPMAGVLLLAAWLVLTKWMFPVGNQPLLGERQYIAEQRRSLGPITPAEWRAGSIFLVTAALWIAREPVEGYGWAPGLRGWLGAGNAFAVDDTTVAMAMALLCFCVPRAGWSGQALADWSVATKVPWGVLLLFGGGLALAKGMGSSGLDQHLGQWFGGRLAGASPLAMAVATAAGMTFLSELSSNLAIVTMGMPVLASVATGVGCDPRLLMVVATLAASCAFMLPAGTPPNAIVYGTGLIKMREMVRAGFVLNWIGVVLIVGAVWLLGEMGLGIDWNGAPEWAGASAEKP